MSLRTYEALYIVTPDLEDDAIQTVAKDIEKIVTDHGGAIVRSEIWGKRRLAYTVKKHTEGCYVLMRFDADPAVIKRLETHFRLSDQIIRHLVVHFDERTLRLEAEQQRRKEEEIRSGGHPGRRDRDDDEDDAPIRGGRRSRHRDEDDDDEPVRGRRSRGRDEEDDEDDDVPVRARRSRSRDDEDDD